MKSQITSSVTVLSDPILADRPTYLTSTGISSTCVKQEKEQFGNLTNPTLFPRMVKMYYASTALILLVAPEASARLELTKLSGKNSVVVQEGMP